MTRRRSPYRERPTFPISTGLIHIHALGRAAIDGQELSTESSTGVTYWEGAIELEGTRGGAPIRGRGWVACGRIKHRLQAGSKPRSGGTKVAVGGAGEFYEPSETHGSPAQLATEPRSGADGIGGKERTFA